LKESERIKIQDNDSLEVTRDEYGQYVLMTRDGHLVLRTLSKQTVIYYYDLMTSPEWKDKPFVIDV
jgi:hypothetical protein